jgi:hypothetical protein
MSRLDTFTFRVNKDERRLIARLAKQLQRSQSDAVRFVVISAVKELDDYRLVSNQDQNHDEHINSQQE